MTTTLATPRIDQITVTSVDLDAAASPMGDYVVITGDHFALNLPYTTVAVVTVGPENLLLTTIDGRPIGAISLTFEIREQVIGRTADGATRIEATTLAEVVRRLIHADFVQQAAAGRP